MELSIHDKMKRHMGLPVTFTLVDNEGNEDEFEFVPLDAPEIIDMIAISTDIRDSGKMSKENTLSLMELVKKMIKKSYPELNDEEIEHFVAFHSLELTQILYKLHGYGEDATKQRLRELKEKKK